MTDVTQNWHDMTVKLANKHGLAFTHNPGGGQFYRTSEPAVDIQIHMQDDKDDYERLLAGLAKAGMEA